MKHLLAALLILTAAACAPTTTAPPADAGPQITEAIHAQETALNAAITAENAAAVAAIYAPDAQMFNPFEAPATTPAAVEASYQRLFDDANGSLTLTGGDVIVPSSSDYAVAQGTFTVSFTDPQSHRRVDMAGNYVTLWRKQDDDSWKVVRDIATPGPPPAQ